MVRKRTKKSFDGEVILLIHHNGINFGISVPHFLDHSPTVEQVKVMRAGMPRKDEIKIFIFYVVKT